MYDCIALYPTSNASRKLLSLIIVKIKELVKKPCHENNGAAIYVGRAAILPVQLNLSNTDTEGTEQSVRIREVFVVYRS